MSIMQGNMKALLEKMLFTFPLYAYDLIMFKAFDYICVYLLYMLKAFDIGKNISSLHD